MKLNWKDFKALTWDQIEGVAGTLDQDSRSRYVLEAFYKHGQSIDAIAKRVGVSKQRVHEVMHQAFAELAYHMITREL
jgi:DNA-directed RNA polymerase specialized sigma subunit